MRNINIVVAVCLTVAICVGSFGTTGWAARWYENYEEGRIAAREQDWTRAIELFRKALDTEPNPGKRKRTYGTTSIAYYPYLELGKAYLAIGDRAAATRFCTKSKTYGAAPKEDVEACLLSAAEPIPAQPSPAPVVQTPVASSTAVPVFQRRMKVAVLDFESILAQTELGRAVSEILRTRLVGYELIERGMLEQVLSELELPQSGLVDEETAARIGQLAGAELVIIGSVVKIGSSYTINARLIDVETGIVKAGESVNARTEDEIAIKVNDLAAAISARSILPNEDLSQ